MKNYFLILLSIMIAQNGNAQTEMLEEDTTQIVINDSIPAEFEQMYDECYAHWMNSIREDLGIVTYVDSNYYSANYAPITFPDSVYLQRLDSLILHTPIRISYNPIVKNYIEMYTGKRSLHLATILGVSEYYFPIFEEVLFAHQLPMELKYLPVIESALNPIARSRVGACGLWQFMPSTGKQYRLEINSYIDERYDPYKASEAAARFLSDLYNIYQDWVLVIAAYNCGPGNVNKAIRRSGGKKNYWDIYYHLPKETRGYVPAFFGAMYAMTFHKEHNVYPIVTSMPLSCDTLSIQDAIHFEQIAKNISIRENELRAINPQYYKDVIPAGFGKSYTLKLPYNNIMEYIDNEEKIFSYNRKQYFDDSDRMANPQERFKRYGNSSSYISGNMTRITYTVKRGDVPGSIANKFDVRVSDIRHWNHLNSKCTIRIGQKLNIYVPNKKAASMAKKAGSSVTSTKNQSVKIELIDGEYFYYTVSNGDSLWSISQRFSDITTQDIKRWNGLSDSAVIKPGQKLKIKKM